MSSPAKLKAPRRPLKVDSRGVPVRNGIGHRNGDNISQVVKGVAVPAWLSETACHTDGMKWRRRLAYLRVQEINLLAASMEPWSREKDSRGRSASKGIKRELDRVRKRIETSVEGVEVYG